MLRLGAENNKLKSQLLENKYNQLRADTTILLNSNENFPLFFFPDFLVFKICPKFYQQPNGRLLFSDAFSVT